MGGASRGGPGGLIVQTASMASFLAGFDTIEEGMYTCSKQGVLGLVRSMGRELPSFKKEKVRMVGISPLFIEPEEVRKQLDSGNVSVSERYKTRLLEPEEIGLAFQRLVVGGESGQMLVVMPGFNFYWPDWNRSMIKIFSMICMFCVKVMRHPASEPIIPKQMRNVGIVFFLLIGYAAHLLLNYLGC